VTDRPRILLGVSGGIAAYKAAELVRLLVKDGCDVRVVMTRAATQFVTPLTLQILSGHPVLVHLFEGDGAGVQTWAGDDVPDGGAAAARAAGAQARDYALAGASGIEHIDVVKEADVVVVAPATADLLAKAAHGIADDALTTVLLAAGPAVLFAPAMNHRMWNHPATQAAVATLVARGARIVEPGAGYQACGETGVGRLADPAEIHAAIRARLARRRDLTGKTVLLTAGRTEEPVDPVRVLTNRSSGRMGVALAEEARDRGASVVLVAGVLSVAEPTGVRIVSAVTAEAMRRAVLAEAAKADIVIGAAAVADFRPVKPAAQKLKRSAGVGSIVLEPTVDILKAAAAKRRPGQLFVGFALETTDELAGARRKLAEKGVDVVVLNNPTKPGSAFGGATNEVTILDRSGRAEALPLQSKRDVARALFDRLVGGVAATGRPARGPRTAPAAGRGAPGAPRRGDGSSPKRTADQSGPKRPAARAAKRTSR
jgi:phosphopantothenoylcysteine decarboxylase/phosphopantothenate--cysteine ligase